MILGLVMLGFCFASVCFGFTYASQFTTGHFVTTIIIRFFDDVMKVGLGTLIMLGCELVSYAKVGRGWSREIEFTPLQ